MGWLLSLIGMGLIFCQTVAATRLTVSTFNIRWYGLAENRPAASNADFRNSYIKAYLRRTVPDSDVIVFQEIVDLFGFYRNVMGSRMRCHSYQHSHANHQHVVLCHKKHLKFNRVRGDSNYKLEAVAMGSTRSRPALWGTLKTKSGKILLHVVGVHLKAFPNYSSTRLNQVRAMARAIKKLGTRYPVLVTGDFNTYYASQTGESASDLILIDRVFKQFNLGLYHVPNRYRFTFRNEEHGNKFDHIWLSRGLRLAGAIRVGYPCRTPSSTSRNPFDRLEFYNTYVSDHCPVTVSFNVP